MKSRGIELNFFIHCDFATSLARESEPIPFQGLGLLRKMFLELSPTQGSRIVRTIDP